jgi:hypothetical protein
VQKQDRRVRRIARGPDVKFDAGGKGHALMQHLCQ